MSRTGFLAYWRQEFRPYLRAAASQFAPDHPSLTERLLRRRKASS
jgi:type VI protein secretion system component VasA